MGKKLSLYLLLLSLSCLPQLGAGKPKLPEKYKKWIEEEAVYIITPKEKEVFYRLETDEERDRFIEEFWQQRDPTPGTPRNEFREEHYRRIEYANKTFGRGTPTRGWRTDKGRIYIILGEPAQIQKYLNTTEIYPIEIWYYQGQPRFGQAPFFRILFFQRHGGGEFSLYNPISDGPRSLTPLTWLDKEALGASTDDERDRYAHKMIKERVSPELAEASYSSFPGRDGPSFRLPSTILIGEIKTYPHKKVKDDYAYEFLEHKAVVEVSYSVNHMENLSQVRVIQDSSGPFFVHYSIEPEKFSVDFFQDKYYTNLKISLRVTDSEAKTIFQQERNFPVEFKKEQLKEIKQRPFYLCDSFPIIQGNYTFNLLLENTVTKEFTSFEKDISVPEHGSFQAGPLLLASRINRDSPYSQFQKAFQIGNLQIYPSLRNIFLENDTLYIFFQVYGLSQELEDQGFLEFNFYKEDKKFLTERKKVKEFGSTRDFLQEFSLEKFPPGRYMVRASLLDREGEEILVVGEEFSVSVDPLPEPWMATQTNPPLDDPLYLYILGNQFLNKGEIEEARAELEKAFKREPESLDFALSYARVLLIQKEFKAAKEILFPFGEAKQSNFSLYYFLGKSCQEEGELEEAIAYYQKALSHKGNIVDVLNSIGECYYFLGDTDQALQAWKKSLEINPNQEKIKKILEVLKEKKKG